jgi:energy-coupling factor transporter ATP-binding protein EcfA2
VNEPASSSGRGHHRWSLNRAGILNVYQYDDEVLDFAGGRLLLRGVNGSGKSTAMNMLLPFLLTARQSRIDAAGEQSRVLRSWMLADRDEAQPVGYLWIELVRGDGRSHLSFGCGIKANRGADSVTTWWFITTRRPAVDLQLVTAGVPLSADALRAELGGDPVYNHTQRADYRHELGRRLFGGADLDQHLRLLDVVRNPRLGDRFDRALPDHLTNALPELSAQAVDEAARPLEDLDEHRRNVADLAATSAALEALVEIYRQYVGTELAERSGRGRRVLRAHDDAAAEVGRRRRAKRSAADHEQQATDLVAELEAGRDRLELEIETLEASDHYQEGRQLEDLRETVRLRNERYLDLARQQEGLAADQATEAGVVTSAATTAAEDRARLVDQVADIVRSAGATGVVHPPLTTPVIVRVEAGDGSVVVPDGPYDPSPLAGSLDATITAIRQREADIDQIERLTVEVDTAARAVARAERDVELRAQHVTGAEQAHRDTRRALTEQTESWRAAASRWASEVIPLVSLVPVEAPATVAASADPAGPPDELRAALAAEMARVVSDRLEAATSARYQRDEARRVVDERAQVVAELASRHEPDPPRLPWQSTEQYCLADLVDFAPDLDPSARAGLEGALEGSGLLSSTLTSDGVQLADGELVVLADTAVDHPLSRLLRVTLPADHDPEVDVGRVQKVLDSITTRPDHPVGPDEGPPAAVAADGRFRVGPLAGRYTKAEAEHIGITARRAKLERLRAEAAAGLETAEGELAARQATLDEREVEWNRAEQLAAALPPLDGVVAARAAADEAELSLADRRAELDAARAAAADADAAHADIADERERVASSLQLPTDPGGLRRVQGDLSELRTGCSRAADGAVAVRRSVGQWIEAGQRWQRTTERLAERTRARDDAASRLELDASKLASLEDSIGIPYQEILAARETAAAELSSVTGRLPSAREERDTAVRATVEAGMEADRAAERLTAAAGEALDELAGLRAALAVPGLLDVLPGGAGRGPGAGAEPGPSGGPGAGAEPGPVPEAGQPPPLDTSDVEDTVDGLRLVVDRLAGAVAPPAAAVTADSVRRSVRQRRDALGAGWDAEDRQPDPLLPLHVLVEGPLGRMPLAAALSAARSSHRRLAGLLTTKQDTALRDLLQGLLATEVAEKLDRAAKTISAMNRHLVGVTTSHGIGVELRWRRRPDVEGVSDRMVDLLATLPDLRTDDQERELRALVSARLDEARRLDPELSYRQLISEALDYRNWYEMTVLLRRGRSPVQKLTARIAGKLSEGEKKLVTYLPFLAAVAVSYDGLAEQAPEAPRIVLLDDAMAKVSEDNHADLLGLLVDLDLDFIATSERLWGTHATMPCLSIVEVIRDADLGAIVLERYRWDGHTLHGGADPGSDPGGRPG